MRERGFLLSFSVFYTFFLRFLALGFVVVNLGINLWLVLCTVASQALTGWGAVQEPQLPLQAVAEKHGRGFLCSVEEVVGHHSIKSAACLNKAVVLVLETVEQGRRPLGRSGDNCQWAV